MWSHNLPQRSNQNIRTTCSTTTNRLITTMKIAIIGKGSVGTNLGLLLQSGHGVSHIGRSDSAETVAALLQDANMVLLATPYSAVTDIATKYQESLENKIVVDATNPVRSDWSPETNLGGHGSAAEHIQAMLPDSEVVKCFNTIFADNMVVERLKTRKISTFVAGNDKAACETVADLADSIGFDAIQCGALDKAQYLEGMAHLNIALAVGMGRGTSTGFLYFSEEK